MGKTAARDAVKNCHNNYTVDFENDNIRVERISYGPSDKSVINLHAEGVLVFLNDHHVRLTFTDGATSEYRAKAGRTLWQPGLKHLPENLGDGILELMLIKHKV